MNFPLKTPTLADLIGIQLLAAAWGLIFTAIWALVLFVSWNSVVPDLTHLPYLTYPQSFFGLLVLNVLGRTILRK